MCESCFWGEGEGRGGEGRGGYGALVGVASCYVIWFDRMDHEGMWGWGERG